MAIKKRPPLDPAREAEIEAFGRAADPAAESAPAPKAAAPTKPEPSRPRPAPTKTKAPGAKAVIKPMLMRFDVDQHELLKEVAELEGRSMHNMALTALIPALEAIRDVHQK